MLLKPASKDFVSLPITGNVEGDLRVVLDTGLIYQWEASSWVYSGSRISLVNCYPISTEALSDSNTSTLFMSPVEHEKVNLISVTQPMNLDVLLSDIDSHFINYSNPHAVTKSQVGLSNVDNTSDINKPISTATQTALSLKSDASYVNSHISNLSNPHSVTKTQVGLSNVDNTSDLNKPISTATQTALNGKISTVLNSSQILVGNGSNVAAPISLSGDATLTSAGVLSLAASGVSPATYGSSSLVPVLTVNAKGLTTSVSTTVVDKLYDHWHGTTQYASSQLRRYTNSASTDSAGRVTFNLTQNGLVGGVALFSTILTYNAIVVDSSGSAIQGPFAIVESVTATAITFRAIRGTSTGVLIGGTVVSAQFAGAGYSVRVLVEGVK